MSRKVVDPTPEEIPTWILYVLESHGIDSEVNNPENGLAWRIYEQHRAAVAAEREHCAKVEPADIQCPKCDAGEGMPCEDEDDQSSIPPHVERWRAAIRRGEGEDG